MLTLLLIVFVVSIVLLGVGTFWKAIWRRDQTRFCERIDAEFLPLPQDQPAASSLFKSLDAIAREVGEVKGAKLSLQQRLDRILLQAAINVSLRRLIQCSVVFALPFVVALGVWQHSLWLGLLATPVGPCIPIAYVWMKWKSRRESLRHQLPDTFDSMARTLRSGQTLEQALQSIGQEFRAPLGPEFSYCFEQQNLGLPRETAFRDLAQRVGLMEVQIMVVAILVQQQSGGNLADLLDKLAVVVRQRFSMREKIRTLTAESKFQSMLLMVLPPLMLVILLIVKKSYIVELFAHPWLLTGVGAMQLLGAIWIHRISNFRY